MPNEGNDSEGLIFGTINVSKLTVPLAGVFFFIAGGRSGGVYIDNIKTEDLLPHQVEHRFSERPMLKTWISTAILCLGARGHLHPQFPPELRDRNFVEFLLNHFVT